MHAGLWLENVKKRNHCEGLDPYGNIILKFILKNRILGCALGLSILRQKNVVDCCESVMNLPVPYNA
jgi:hypothetical protein